MFKRPQHIKKRCYPDEFEAVERGLKVHDVRLANVVIEVGDYITYEEIDKDSGRETGNVTTRKITHITNTNMLEPETVEIKKYGFTVMSIAPPEANTLRSVFIDHFAMGCVVKKDEDDWTIIGGPQYWPLLICPDLAGSKILDNLKINMWPSGVYSIHLKIEPEMETDTDEENPVVHLSIADTFVLVCTVSEDKKEIVSVDVDVASLMQGSAFHVLGDPIEPAPPEVVETYYEDDEDLQKINDGMFSVMPQLNMSDEEFARFLLESEQEGDELDLPFLNKDDLDDDEEEPS